MYMCKYKQKSYRDNKWDNEWMKQEVKLKKKLHTVMRKKNLQSLTKLFMRKIMLRNCKIICVM